MGAAGRDHAAPRRRLAIQCREGRGQGHSRGQQVVTRPEGARGKRRCDVGPKGTRQAHCAFDIELAGALLDDAGIGQRLCRVLQDRLHQRRGQAGVGLQQQGRGTGDRGRGHRGAAEFHHGLSRGLPRAGHLRQLRIGAGQVVPARGQPGFVGAQRCDDAVARRDQVGLDQVVHPLVPAGECVAAAGGPARAEARHHVVAAAGGAQQIGGADGDDRRIVSGRGDGAVNLLSGGVLAGIAGGRDDHQPGLCGPARGACQRVGEERLG